ncbi:WD repeat-containing protein 88-like [Liolophura sinensis]|uniref:WD repeat-containing protein 88-like n=1 Tax=Liolophura sinensis TaxID=3198878 RepID=UPI0031589098
MELALEDDIDPLAIEVTKEFNDQLEAKNEATWEHEDLATVRIKVLRGHSEGVNSCKFFNNDECIVTSSLDKTAKIWNVDSGRVLHTYSAHNANVTQACMSSENNRLVTAGWDKKVHVWDVESGKILWTGKHDGVLTCCDISHDGKLIVTGSDIDNCLKVWDTSSGETIHKLDDIHSRTITSCIFSPNDTRIITTSMDKSTNFWDLKTKTSTLRLHGHINIIASCAMSPDERKFATASWDKTVKIWDVTTGTYRSQGPDILAKGHEGSISCCEFSQDGLQLITGSYDTTIVVWDVDNNVQKLKLQGHGDWVEDVDISQDQKWLLSCSKDKTVRLWNIAESDKIPVVLENRRSIGLKMVKCNQCGKPFSMGQMESLRDVTLCVFCRLQQSEGREHAAIAD